jgi:hypothetical protein
MEDFLNIDVPASKRARPPKRQRTRGAAATAARRPELEAGEPIDIYHWAAVALVTALMCAVLAYAAGTPALSRAANVTSAVFGIAGGTLALAGFAQRLRARLASREGKLADA